MPISLSVSYMLRYTDSVPDITTAKSSLRYTEIKQAVSQVFLMGLDIIITIMCRSVCQENNIATDWNLN